MKPSFLLKSGAALLPIALLATPLQAQTEGQAPAAAEEASAPADTSDIVVTARRREERLQDVPIAATAVSQGELRRYSVNSFSDLKVLAPNISFDKGFSGAGASLTMRGVSASNLDASLEQAILFDIDGMPISRGRIVSDAIFDLAGVDVLKGPQSLFFGKNSPGGVISVKSAGPTDTLTGYIRPAYEFSARQASVEAAISGPLSETLGARLAIYASNSDGYFKNTSPGIANPYGPAGDPFIPAAPKRLGAEQKVAGRLTLKYDGGNGFDATLKVLGSRYRGDGASSQLENMGCPAGQTTSFSLGFADPFGDCRADNRGPQGYIPQNVVQPWKQLDVLDFSKTVPDSYNDTLLPILTMNYKLSDITLTSVTSYYYYRFGTIGSQGASSTSPFWSYSAERNRSFYQEFRAVSGFDGPVNFAAGGYYENNDRDFYVGGHLTYLPADPATNQRNATDFKYLNKSHAVSAFAQINWKLLDNLEVAGGARYTRETKKVDLSSIYIHPLRVAAFIPVGKHLTGKRTEDNVSPEATVSWHVDRNLMLFGAYKTGYLSGGFSNPGTISSTLTIQSDTFDSEKARGFEGGVKFSSPSTGFSGSLVAFDYKYKGLQLTSFDAVAVSFTTKNAANTRSRGVELEGRYRASNAFQLRGSVNYNRARFVNFSDAQCYAGQTTAQGCVFAPGSTTVKIQNLSGKPVYRSPEWILTGGATFTQPVGDTKKLVFDIDARSSSSYFAGLNLNPTSFQKGYVTFNASARLADIDDRWSVAVIGRNLTNRHYAPLAIDTPGGNGEAETIANEPRAVMIQLERRF
ncbi:TonB-dependent receptor [Rhizorhabdus dicambivorans]|uniref:TonB-dependent receptor n=1 Tax=Rhizorhabdus dicambivorans TaxID=1850238 RepID=A0A2A4FYT5_9SPHN|nr:TonB-dependent receptor [Rhizorhabdus dicambivorans]ATE63193.1 hypothetical protein CMV14_01270 [Rhizorhabdus dicambivorans]PCE43370.1 hypothetical protein COO09_06315 [Rhizorhabdus dicambivorans]